MVYLIEQFIEIADLCSINVEPPGHSVAAAVKNLTDKVAFNEHVLQ